MTRIIAGTAGGRRLSTPPGEATRPTSDRVREALFSALESQLGTLAGRSVLDLYAGSAALALEACSRGAVRAVAVESERRAARVAAANASTTGLPVRVVTRSARSYVAQPADTVFDVVLLDPPYPLENDALVAVLADLVDNGWVAPGGVVVVERSARTVEPTWPQGLQQVRRRKYGETVLFHLDVVPADSR